MYLGADDVSISCCCEDRPQGKKKTFTPQRISVNDTQTSFSLLVNVDVCQFQSIRVFYSNERGRTAQHFFI